MFTLRRITSESIEFNTCLGASYILILRERNSDEFESTAKLMKWNEADITKDMYGFISHNEGKDIIPLYQKSHYFIMTEAGKTFCNLTFK